MHGSHSTHLSFLLSHSSNRYSLYPISDEENMPKALLPVANKPIISYTLEWLEKAGIHGNDPLSLSLCINHQQHAHNPHL